MFRTLIQSLLPEGPLWKPMVKGGLDLYYNGIAAISKIIRDDLSVLADYRNPYKTPLLDELELDYGVLTNPNFTDQQRRDYLAALMSAQKANGSSGFLQQQLHKAGFTDLYVYENSPAVDPSKFFSTPLLFCGDSNAYCGEPTAELGEFQGELVVNGELYEFKINYTAVCGDTDAYCGEPDFTCGELTGVESQLYEYALSTDQVTWPAVFFVGGPNAVFAPAQGVLLYCDDTNAYCGEPTAMCQDFDGGLLSIDYVNIQIAKRKEIINIILKYKPLCTWGELLVNWTA